MRSSSHPPNLPYFEQSVLVHLDAAYNLARWLTGDNAAAEDVVQEASMRALRAFHSLSGPNPKAWFMAVVRNVAIDWLRSGKRRARDEAFDDELHGDAAGRHGAPDMSSAFEPPELQAMRASDRREVHAAIAALPVEFREAIVLRELEELSYKEISAIVNVPIGTVMSRISRGRDLLEIHLRGPARKVKS